MQPFYTIFRINRRWTIFLPTFSQNEPAFFTKEKERFLKPGTLFHKSGEEIYTKQVLFSLIASNQ